MALRLHVAAHHAEAHLRLAVFREERRDDGVERPLARRHAVRAGRIEREAVAAVLHRDAPFRHDDARAEAHVVALDEAHHHPALVGGAEIDRAALGRMALREALRLVRIDQLRPRGEVALVEHLVGRQAHAAALVGDVLVGVGEAQLHGLDHQVLALGAVDRHRGDVEVAQDAERDQRRDALPVRRDLVQAVAPGSRCRSARPTRGAKAARSASVIEPPWAPNARPMASAISPR